MAKQTGAKAVAPLKTALVAGSTGLVGLRLVELLADAHEYARVIALARKPAWPARGSLEWRAADFENLSEVLRDVRGSASAPLDVFCCLGTTIKNAGSQEAFRRVDFDYVVAVGRWAASASARRLLVISALGANPASRVFYNRVKGEAEAALRGLGLTSLVLLHPSLLDGDRKEFRLGERLTLAAARPLRALFPMSVRPVRDIDVAATMLEGARAENAPSIIASADMHGAAERIRFAV